MAIKVGIAPDSWGVWFPDHEKQTPWYRCMDEMKVAGYDGVELGPWGYFPNTNPLLKNALDARNLTLVAGTVGGDFLDDKSIDALCETIDDIAHLLKDFPEAKYIVLLPAMYTDLEPGEQVMDPNLTDEQWKTYCKNVQRAADRAASRGFIGAFHPHVDCHVQTEEQIERLLNDTDVVLCFDTGHHVYGGGSGGGSSSSGGSSSGGSSSGGSSSGGGDEYNISVILKTTASEYWGYVVAGANAYGKDHPNVHVEVKGASSETAYDEQQNMIETDMANADIDGYVISPLQADMVANMISGQTKPVIAVDTNIEAPEILSFVGTGNEAAAKLGAVAAVELAKARGWTDINCIEIAGVQGDSTNESRMAGYKAGIEAAGGTFLSDEVQYANAVADQAVTCMEAIMQNHPEGIAVICANNDDMAMAAARAAAGNAAYENTVFLGFDGIQSACNAILENNLTMSVCQEAYTIS